MQLFLNQFFLCISIIIYYLLDDYIVYIFFKSKYFKVLYDYNLNYLDIYSFYKLFYLSHMY